MEKWQTGDIAAFEALFREYEKVVFKNAFLITGRREDAEDALQEVFTSVWRSRHTYDPSKGKLSTWLHRITVNECMRKRRKKTPAYLALDEIEVADKQPPIEDRLSDRTDYERLTRAMDALDAKHRTVLVLRYFNDLSYEEVAKAVGIPLGTVKSRINHALKALRTKLGDRDS